MNKEFEQRLKTIIRECIHEEIIAMKQKQLNEMARVGIMNNIYDVIVYTDDRGYIPHVHIIDRTTKGEEFNCCVRLEANRYFKHGSHQDEFNSSQCKLFNDFMHQPCRSPKYRNNYEFAVEMWNANNSNSYVQITEDENGDIIMPNYDFITD